MSRLPCPFCGSKADCIDCDNGYYCYCRECRASSNNYPTYEEATDKWNTRASYWIDVKDELPERCREGFKKYLVASWSPVRQIYHVGCYDWIDTYFQDSIGEKVSFDDGYWIITHWMPLPMAPNILIKKVENEKD